jgi:diaminohydroxyphosphoribosylaminopyrimidine deaminase/5-amino-6-(5-phosphoribosylamino)uracil reductase
LTDEELIKKTLRLAQKGRGHVSPNPMVGALIVKNHRIIARGYHHAFGREHAEVEAFNAATANVKGGSLYVNLEPCSHFGKQPPCVDRILASGIKRVIVGTRDPNPLVNGKGITKLQKHGIEVKVGIAEEACKKLNEAYFKHITTGLPFTTLKIAQTLDGRIAARNGHSKWITSETSRRVVHKLRSQHDAVLVGIGTVLADNPQLTVRLSRGVSPKRIVLDSKLRVALTSNLLTDGFVNRTIIATTREAPDDRIKRIEQTGAQVWVLPASTEGRVDLLTLWRKLGQAGIASVLVEGGSQIYSSLLKANLVDKICVFIAPKILGDGLSALQNLGITSLEKSISLIDISRRNLDGVLLVTGRVAEAN